MICTRPSSASRSLSRRLCEYQGSSRINRDIAYLITRISISQQKPRRYTTKQQLYIATCQNRVQPHITTKVTSHPKSTTSVPSLVTRQVHDETTDSERNRLENLRNVGVLAHVDAGKTTVTERMLALAGIVSQAGSVDSGNTVTDYLPAERERGITIQSAVISLNWVKGGQETDIRLIDTPGHVDFSVEVNRSVAVLDGAVLIIDAVAGVQAQTETVWRAMTRSGWKNHVKNVHENYRHEPLPCVAMINKMDKEGCNYSHSIDSLRHKLPGANPVAIQIPLFAVGKERFSLESRNDGKIAGRIIALPVNKGSTSASFNEGHFVGVVDLVRMCAILWPDVSSSSVSNVEECVPSVYNLLDEGTNEQLGPNSQVQQIAMNARKDIISALAEVDESMEIYFLGDEDASNCELLASLRRATLARKILPVLAGAAFRGKGVEPLLDAVVDLLPSPNDRSPPTLIQQGDDVWEGARRKKKKKIGKQLSNTAGIKFGHPLHPSLLALAFKVMHLKNRGGSGEGRVVFARVYSGKVSVKDRLKIISPSSLGKIPTKPRIERVGGMLELAGGQFNNLKDSICKSGDVCALTGLTTVVTGDTLMLASDNGYSSREGNRYKNKKISRNNHDFESLGNVCLAGVSSPKPVLSVRVEAESTQQQVKLIKILTRLVAEDPSLHLEETASATLLSGLGELHIEVTIDRLKREHDLSVWLGKPSVAYHETVQNAIETIGLIEYNRTIGSTKLQASVHLVLEPIKCSENIIRESSCVHLSDPVVKVGDKAREFLELDKDVTEEELAKESDIAHALISGCLGALKRGPLGGYPLANVRCHVLNIDAMGGLAALNTLPGSMRAAVSSAISSLLFDHKSDCLTLEPTMSINITVPGDLVGSVLSDLTTRRGTVWEVLMSDDMEHANALIRGEVPLAEILGYANSLRSITGGEGAFTVEYNGHSICDQMI